MTTTTRRIIGVVLLIALAAAPIVIALASGWRLDRVTSGSMQPAYAVGDYAVTRPATAADLAVGDVARVSADDGGSYVHRVVELDADTITTQGDANGEADLPVPLDRVEGIVVAHVGGAGAQALTALTNPFGRGLAVGVLLTIVAQQLQQAVVDARAYRRQRARSTAPTVPQPA